MNQDSPTGRPSPLAMHHIALYVENFAACEAFYTELLGMQVEWRPDADNVYLTGGWDNLALHRAGGAPAPDAAQRLDHLGFVLPDAAAVDSWHDYLRAHGIRMVAAPRTHRDGARSFYCLDPAGNRVQFIHHPPLAPVMRCLATGGVSALRTDEG